MRKHLYLLIMVGDLEPCLEGPFATDDERDEFARAHRKEEGDDDGIYPVEVQCDAPFKLIVDTYSGAFFEDDEDDEDDEDN